MNGGKKKGGEAIEKGKERLSVTRITESFVYVDSCALRDYATSIDSDYLWHDMSFLGNFTEILILMRAKIIIHLGFCEPGENI